jgi:HK97 family phage portal protein
MEGSKGHLSKEQRDSFIATIAASFGKSNTFKALMLPHGVKEPTQLNIENDKAQFLETRKLQRSVIAGAFGVPPHLVGDLERATFSNIEQQSREFVEKVILPYVRMFETAMEADLLTSEDRAGGVAIRFNLDSALRADFKTRQEGLKIQREMGVINANEWREEEGRNPREDGDDYWDEGPSGQNQQPDSEDGKDPSAQGESSDAAPDAKLPA